MSSQLRWCEFYAGPDFRPSDLVHSWCSYKKIMEILQKAISVLEGEPFIFKKAILWRGVIQ